MIVGLKEKWLNTYQKLLDGKGIGRPNPVSNAEFEQILLRVSREALLSGIEIAETVHPDQRDKNVEAVVESMRKDCRAGRESIAEVYTNYIALNKHFQDFNNYRLQETQADKEEKRRYLLYRMLTGIGISLLVLGTGALAHWWGIPIAILK